MELTGQIITTAIELICMVVIAVIGRYIVPAIKTAMNSSKMKELISIAGVYVKAAEQILGAKTGTEKKELVTDYLTSYCEQHNIDIKNLDLDAIIESCVYAINEEKKENEAE